MSSRRRRNRRHDVLIMFLLGVLAVVAALVWLAEHLMVLAGVALLTGTAFYLGQRHERRRAIGSRPGQGQAAGPAAAVPAATTTVPAATMAAPAALAVATMTAPGDWDELSTRQPASLQADRDSLLNTPMSGVRPLRGPFRGLTSF
jgi:hypothetical protein